MRPPIPVPPRPPGGPPASNAPGPAPSPTKRPGSPPPTTVAAPLGWGALALSADAYGWARGYATRVEAERVALANCRKHARRDQCDVRAFEGTTCAAVATWSYLDGNERRYGNIGDFGASLRDAEDRALTTCEAKHRGCKLEYSFCNSQ